MMKKYYAIYGKNALAVYDNGNVAQRNRKFVSGCIVEKFEDFDDAVDSAISGYNNYQVEEQKLKAIYRKETLPKNFMLYRKEIEANAYECGEGIIG